MSNYICTNFEAEKEFSEGRFNPKSIYDSGEMKVILAYFKEGQFIPVHSPNIDVALFIIEGEGEVVAGDKSFKVKKGDLVVVPKGMARGIKALSALSVLHVVQPSPTEKDHQEVKAKLQKGTFK